MKNLIYILFVCLVFAGCGGKRPLTPEEEARLRAQDAIQRAEKTIQTCKKEEVEVEEPEMLLQEAKDAFDARDYVQAKEKADASYEMAKKLLEDARLAKKKAMEEAEAELARKNITSYTVGSWEKDRDCLWNIAKKRTIYDDPWQWKKIYLANKEKIKNPDLIYQGQVFKIPR